MSGWVSFELHRIRSSFSSRILKPASICENSEEHLNGFTLNRNLVLKLCFSSLVIFLIGQVSLFSSVREQEEKV